MRCAAELCRRVLQTGETILQSRDMVSFRRHAKASALPPSDHPRMVKASSDEACRHTTSTQRLGQTFQSHDNCSELYW